MGVSVQSRQMKYIVKRLASDNQARCYHLYEPEGQLQLVADHGSPWLPNEPFRHVRFARPDGHPIASLDLPWATESQQQGAASYAVIHDHAVYAIINAFTEEDRPFAYYTAEVEGQRWLVMQHSAEYHVYADVPSGMTFYEHPSELDLPPKIGQLQLEKSPIEMQMTLLDDQHLSEGGLFTLALVFLLDGER